MSEQLRRMQKLSGILVESGEFSTSQMNFRPASDEELSRRQSATDPVEQPQESGTAQQFMSMIDGWDAAGLTEIINHMIKLGAISEDGMKQVMAFHQ